MKKVNFSNIMLLFLSVLLFSCSKNDDNYKSFDGPQVALLFNNPTSVLEVTAGVSSSVLVQVSATTVADVDRVIPIKVSPFTSAATNQYSIDLSTAVIPAGKLSAFVKILSGDFASLPISGGVNLVLVIDPAQYVLSNRSNNVVSIQRGCTDTKVNFLINFDAYASEISWNLKNSANATVASSTPYGDGLNSFSQVFCLTPGTYTFLIDDSYGDGMSPPAKFEIKSLNGTILATGGGESFGTGPGGSAGPLVYTFTVN